MTRKVKYYIMMVAVIFLSVCLVVTGAVIFKGYGELKSADKKIKENELTIEKQAEENSTLKDELEISRSELEKSQQEKAALESENESLKKEITQLKADKAATVKNTNLPAAPQNPQPVGKVCYLTFDDGPSSNTLEILNVLARYNVKATFFVTDYQYSKIEYLPQIHAAGHTIGLHTKTHDYATVYSSIDGYYADLNALSQKVLELTGVDSKVLRFPGGSSNAVSRKYCSGIMTYLTRDVTEKGYTYFDWNVDSGDATGKLSATKIANNVLAGAKNKTSICVLMHDAAGKDTTPKALPAIIEGLTVQGFTFEPLTQACYGYHHGKLNN